MAGLEDYFEPLSNPIRVRILRELAREPLKFSDLKRRMQISGNGHLEHHLSKLEGLVEEKDGRLTLTVEGQKLMKVLEEYGGFVSSVDKRDILLRAGRVSVLLGGLLAMFFWGMHLSVSLGLYSQSGVQFLPSVYLDLIRPVVALTCITASFLMKRLLGSVVALLMTLVLVVEYVAGNLSLGVLLPTALLLALGGILWLASGQLWYGLSNAME